MLAHRIGRRYTDFFFALSDSTRGDNPISPLFDIRFTRMGRFSDPSRFYGPPRSPLPGSGPIRGTAPGHLGAISRGCDPPDMACAHAGLRAFPPPFMSVGREPPSLTGFRNLTDSHLTECISAKAALCDYRTGRIPIVSPPCYESFSDGVKKSRIADSGAAHLGIPRFLTLGAWRNKLRAFAGSLRPGASGAQSFKNFCKFAGRMHIPVHADTMILRINMFQPGGIFPCTRPSRRRPQPRRINVRIGRAWISRL